MDELLQSAFCKVEENTYLRILLTVSPYSPVRCGNAAAKNSYVRRPINMASLVNNSSNAYFSASLSKYSVAHRWGFSITPSSDTSVDSIIFRVTYPRVNSDYPSAFAWPPPCLREPWDSRTPSGRRARLFRADIR